ncbi:ubiquinone/menaquinone biosynthesis C-methylase UbiE [Lysinibacillus composti]|uniref:Methyltransferase domain-containing protein n=1 Tax=Lysinibacillus composti TaxID=720633 RepID=A0A3N9U4J8_9BACI|nr:class I SAM-dependent methyltransferase [Lysinibacillus composti]MBM7610567.1 ubiquinone/menaquinone biosynthesis C-methylase UbiE [Lysinibacillus composti]RQW71544.1 methyltransferase domain-containing protein [Lysinibacillus composti]
MAIKKTAEEQLVINYMNKLGLKAFKNNRQFWDHLKRKHAKEVVQQLEQTLKDQAEGKVSDEAVFELKNSSLSLSLDMSNISADLYKKYFDWFANRKGPAPKKILNVGCDNGIVTSFLAVLYPEAEVVGVDGRSTAIECANELSSQLALSNVSFKQIQLNELSNHFDENSFDLIVSLDSLQEVMNLKELPRYWSTGEMLEMDFTNERNATLMSLSSILKKNSSSELITCEKLAFMGAVALWTKMLTLSGFQMKWDEAEYIHFHEVGEQQKMPIFIASSQNNLELLQKVYEFESKEKVLTCFDGKVLKEAEAEIVLQQTPNKELQKGIQINFSNDSGIMRIECWQTADFIFLYQYSNIGYRELKVFDHSSINKVVDELEQLIEKWSPYGEMNTYDRVDERDQLNNA